MELKISTLNVCLGLMNKLVLVKQVLMENNIDILCLQEVEIPANVASKNLCISGFNIELEKNSEKSRTCVYISTKVNLFMQGCCYSLALSWGKGFATAMSKRT